MYVSKIRKKNKLLTGRKYLLMIVIRPIADFITDQCSKFIKYKGDILLAFMFSLVTRSYGPFSEYFLKVCKRVRFALIFKIVIAHGKNKTPVLQSSIPILGAKLKRGSTYFMVHFQDRPMFSHIIQKLSARTLN